MKFDVPFYANTPDDTHCFQAMLRMVLKYFLPEKEFSWTELEKLTAKKKNLWTWPMQGYISLQKMGFDQKIITTFDYEKFVKKGASYLLERYGKEVGEAQIRHSDLEQEQKIAQVFVQKIGYQKRTPTAFEIKKFLDEGYLVCCNLNSKALNHKSGYVGHFVLVIGYDDLMVRVHDPGLPPLKDREVVWGDFEKAWAYPNEDVKNIAAFKYE